MALIKCIECGNTISDTADFCPHCGYKKPKAALKITSDQPEKEHPWRGILLCFIGLAAIVIALMIIGTKANYKKYAGTYTSVLGGKYEYANCPTTIVFNEDGSGCYYWKEFTVYFEYSVLGDGTVDMEPYNTGYFDFDGKFEGSTYTIESYSLNYYKKK